MVLSIPKRRTADPFLWQNLQTERFDLVGGNWWRALQVTLPWSRDPEILHSMMYAKSFYPAVEWASRLPRPDGRSLFFHEIIVRDSGLTIGAHLIRLNRSGTAALTIALSEKAWWGKGVVEEVRTALLDHFSRSPRVVRFSGRVLARNVSSVYNYKKLGFRFIGHDRQAWRSPMTGELMDTMFFEQLAEDRRAAREVELLQE